MTAQEIADRLVPIPDNPTLLDRINQSMNKGVKHGINYVAKDLMSMFPDVKVHDMDVDDALTLLQKIKVKLLEYGI